MEEQNTTEEENKIIASLFEQPTKAFATHLNIDGNSRILFSGSYGSGKTTFLNHFFKSQDAINKYELIHLFPVNYSVAANEDIFRFIKFDIIYSLLLKKVYLSEDKIPMSFVAYFYFMNKTPELISFLVSLASEKGKVATTVIDKATELFKGLTEYNKAINKKPMQEVEAYMQEIIQNEGSIYEDNVSTQLINQMLDHFRTETAIQVDGEKKSEKQLVLIVDDLDRIDPHHIFRLFNVFAAHFDNRFNEKSNKFGFDKVIFVCDINNIRNIFYSNYGTGTDFSGYIDKFYTYNIFYFDNSESIIEVLEKVILDEMSLVGVVRGYSVTYNMKSSLTDSVVLCLSDIVLERKVNLRTLFKFRGKTLTLNNKELRYAKGGKISMWQLEILLVIDVLAQIFGDIDKLEAVLAGFENIEERNLGDRNEIATNSLILLTCNKHHFERSQDGLSEIESEKWTFTLPEANILYRFTLSEDNNREYYGEISEIKPIDKSLNLKEPHYLYLIYKCVSYLRSIHYLKNS